MANAAYEEVMKVVSRPASGDLSSNQYCFVKLDSNGKLALCASGDLAFGVLQDAPSAAGRAGRVCIDGVTKVVVGGSITQGATVVSDASGRAVASGSGDANTNGQSITGGGTAGDLQTIKFQPIGLT